MSKPLNPHSKFFSSLNQVEKRLKLDKPALKQSSENDHTLTESLISSPIYLHIDHYHQNSSILQESGTPLEFLTNSVDFPPTNQNPLPESPQSDCQPLGCVETDVDTNVDDDIGLLIGLLGLSEMMDGSEEDGILEGRGCSSCHCGGGFLEKVVGVKGPKCRKERERLEGWIRHFRREEIEPVRLAHLLLGKAASIASDGKGDGCGFEGVEFPSTVEEFLRVDPPTKF